MKEETRRNCTIGSRTHSDRLRYDHKKIDDSADRVVQLRELSVRGTLLYQYKCGGMR